MSGATANGFQMVVAGSQAKSLGDFQITNIQVSKKITDPTGANTVQPVWQCIVTLTTH